MKEDKIFVEAKKQGLQPQELLSTTWLVLQLSLNSSPQLALFFEP